MKNLILSAVLIALPVALFATGFPYLAGTSSVPSQVVADSPSFGNIDAATDAALDALRAATPDA